MRKYLFNSLMVLLLLGNSPSVNGQWFTNANGDIQANNGNSKVLTGVLPGTLPGRFNIAASNTMPHISLFGGPSISTSVLTSKFNINNSAAASLGIITSNNISGGGLGMLEGPNVSSPIVWMYNSSFGYNAFTVASANYMPSGLTTIENAFNVLLQVRENGNVGIGTPNPTQKLEISGSILLNAENSAFGIDAQANARLGFIKKSGTYPSLASVAGSPIIFSQTDQSNLFSNISSATITERMRIDASGNVGIGTTLPGTTLSVSSDSEDQFHLSRKTGATGDNIYLAFSHGNNSNSNNARARIGVNILAGGAGRLVFQTGSGGVTPERMRIDESGNVGIGTTSPDTKLSVKGAVHANEIKVDLNVPGPDYVFENDYKLTPLDEIKTYIDQNKHLPEVPSAKEMEKNGVKIGEMNMLLLKKIEELTLYVIEQKKDIEALKSKNEKLELQMISILPPSKK